MIAPRAPVKIHLSSLPAAAGLSWIRRALRTFFRRPAGFMGLFGLVLFVLLVLALLPPAAQMFALALMPLLSLGFMLATEAVLDDLPVRPSLFWAPMAAGPAARRALVNIGLVYVLVFLLIFLFGDRIDGGEANRWLQAVFTPKADGTLPEPTPISGAGTLVVLLRTFGLALVSVPLWHAPALVHWGRQGAAQAMFSSVVSIWRTRAAFAAYMLGWCAIGLLFTLLLFVVGSLLGNLQLAVAVMTPVSWALSAVFYISIWFGFVDTFQISAAAPAR